MTKISLLLAAALTFAAAVPASAGESARQRVDGCIQEATGYATGECRFEVHRSAMLMTGESSVANAVVGHSFDVDPATVGARFTLRPMNEVPRDADLRSPCMSRSAK